MMPEMDGYELGQQLKKEVWTSHIPTVLLTAKVNQESKYRGFELGAGAYLAKPFDKKELLLCLENLLLLRKQMQLNLALIKVSIVPSSSTSKTTKKELFFLQKLHSTVAENLANGL